MYSCNNIGLWKFKLFATSSLNLRIGYLRSRKVTLAAIESYLKIFNLAQYLAIRFCKKWQQMLLLYWKWQDRNDSLDYYCSIANTQNICDKRMILGKTCSNKPCDQHLTAENILDNFCRADFGELYLNFWITVERLSLVDGSHLCPECNAIFCQLRFPVNLK